METIGPNPQEVGLYPERISSESYLDHKIAEIKAVAEGAGRIELSESERTELLVEENELGEELEGYFSLKPRSASFHMSYLESEAGRAKLTELTGKEVPAESEEIRRFLWQNIDVFKGLTSKERAKLKGESTDFEDKRRFEALAGKADVDGGLDVEGFRASEDIALGLDPEKTLAKAKGYRKLKAEIKSRLAELRGKDALSELESARILIYEIYLSKINTLIAAGAGPRNGLRRKADLLGRGSLSEVERELLGLREDEEAHELPQERAQLINSRYDKFIHGADRTYNEAGWREQIGAEIERYAQEIGQKWYESQINRDATIREHGLDPEKLDKKEVVPEVIKENLEKLLASAGMLSAVEEFDPDREGPAEDGLWQVYIRPGAKSFGVNGKQKVINASSVESSKLQELTVAYGHEAEHAIQHENKSKIPLRLFKMMGGGRAEAFAEGGAMAIQAELSKDLFGIESGAHPHYVKGMLAKLQGGGYGDVVKAFYQSEISPQVALFKQGALTEEAFRQERERALKLAINRSKRIMSGAKDVKGVDFLTSSKDTVYLEQTLLAQKLNEAGVSFALNIVGVSLDNIIRLMKLGLLNPQNMVKLDLNFSKGIWEHQKAEYTL